MTEYAKQASTVAEGKDGDWPRTGAAESDLGGVVAM
jgi:hypothetical protein